MSSSESKKKSRSKKDDQDEKPVEEEVHTANNWEKADLGDDQRKAKFLRLMGAKKRKDETGTDRQNSHDSNPDEDVSPEKKHCRSKEETETINQELEKQFTESLQAKITHTHHGGLGFHGESGSTSGSGDWQHQSTKTKFLPAKTEVGSAMDHVVVEEQEKVEDKSSEKKVEDTSSEKKEKKKKSKSSC